MDYSVSENMETPVQTKSDVVERVKRPTPDLRDLGVLRLAIFGSFVRDDAHDDSEVDVLVDFDPEKKSFDNFMRLSLHLEEAFHRPVEVVTREALSPHIGPHILKEAEEVGFYRGATR